MNDILTIGTYQLRNLINERAIFAYFDLRPESLRASESIGHELLKGSQPVTRDQLLVKATEMSLPKNAPVVLICESGANSMAAAQELAQNGFINVYVVLDGTRSF